MDATQGKAFQRLVQQLEDMAKHYRMLLDIVRKEKEILISANIENLQKINLEKESLLTKIQTLDLARVRYAKELGTMLGIASENPRLLEIAKKIENSDEEKKLRAQHAMLEMLIQRVTSLNQENEQYAQSALDLLNGAMSNVKETLVGKNTYARKGQMEYGPHKSGNFVKKEA